MEWVAEGAYPWNWCPIVRQQRDEKVGYALTAGPRGQIRLKAATGELKNRVAARNGSPVWNPALSILGWDTPGASLTIDGERIARGPEYRLGQRHGLESSDLIVWFRHGAFETVLASRQDE